MLGRLLLIAVPVTACVMSASAAACACGIALDATVTGERALVIEHPGREEIVAGFDLESEGGGRAAVVLPVPGDPKIGAIEHGDPLAYLDAATATAAPRSGGDDDETAGAGPPGVDVIGRATVGGYDVARLRAGDPRALERWLDRNGYALPAGAAAILADYVEQGWRYVAIRLAPGSSGRLKPLRISFPTARPVYPMRLSQLASEPVSVTLYVLADGPRAAAPLGTRFRGPVARLDPPVPAELLELLGAAPYLTKLQATSVDAHLFTEDLAIAPAPPAAAPAPPPADDDGVPVWPFALGVVARVAALALFVRARRV